MEGIPHRRDDARMRASRATARCCRREVYGVESHGDRHPAEQWKSHRRPCSQRTTGSVAPAPCMGPTEHAQYTAPPSHQRGARGKKVAIASKL